MYTVVSSAQCSLVSSIKHENQPDRKWQEQDERLGVHEDRWDSWWGLGWLLPVKELLRTQISSGSLVLAGVHKALGLSGGEPSKHTHFKGFCGGLWARWTTSWLKKRPSRDTRSVKLCGMWGRWSSALDWKVSGTDDDGDDDEAWEVLHNGIVNQEVQTTHLKC